MPRKGNVYSEKRMTHIAAQSRRLVVDELRDRYTRDTFDGLQTLRAYVAGMITGGCRDAEIHRAVFHLDSVLALMLALDQEVVDGPGF